MTARRFTTRQVAELLGDTEWSVRRACDRLDLPVTRVGRIRLLTADMLAAVRRHLAARRVIWPRKQEVAGNAS
jgi:hypothetical protein